MDDIYKILHLGDAARLQSGRLRRLVQVHAVIFVLLRVVLDFDILPRVRQVDVVQLIRVHVGVEAAHDGEDDADAQQQAGEQQELFPLRQ